MRVLSLLAASLLLLTACGGSKGSGPDVLLILIDTLRADHVHCYGYDRETTPVLDSLAVSGTVFTQLQSQSPWTLPAMATILTGVSPVEHGAGRGNTWEFFGISPELYGMPYHFHSMGYETAAIFNVIFMSEEFGFHRGFDHFDCQGLTGRRSLRTADTTVDLALEWLDTREGDSPFFLAVHFYDPHIPYNPPEPWNTIWTDPGYAGDYDCKWGTTPEMMAVNSGEVTIPEAGLDNIIALYDGEIAFTDNQIGRLLSGIRTMGIADNTVVMVLSDHGEEFLDHGRVEHGVDLYQETLHVPLIIAGPGVPEGAVVDVPVSQMDVFPTLCILSGLQPPENLPGVDILDAPPEGRAIPSSGVLWAEGDMAAIRRDGMKAIWYAENDSLESYDLTEDALELHDRGDDLALLDAILYYWATPPLVRAPLVPWGDAMDRELRDLGYIR